jgi:hypothetical protein
LENGAALRLALQSLKLAIFLRQRIVRIVGRFRSVDALGHASVIGYSVIVLWCYRLFLLAGFRYFFAARQARHAASELRFTQISNSCASDIFARACRSSWHISVFSGFRTGG